MGRREVERQAREALDLLVLEQDHSVLNFALALAVATPAAVVDQALHLLICQLDL